ncbi:hypothetical protein N7495_000703 [Penicillium taxi]|uniref:uncharacterized protein n=1 Tax=Penicillium taxi TaxID=168475 RepID=UPI0025458AE4|nr:uncharacterized protein N7495_000703 [Penicillium taxi]KAJ5908021.1 hypothetical protein N7495_000703 [Penicillium taxi]
MSAMSSYSDTDSSGSFCTPPPAPASTDLPKPPLPYQTGWKFTAQHHVAPPPKATRIMHPFYAKKKDHVERSQLSPFDRCLIHQPLHEKPPSIQGDDIINLEILGVLKVGVATHSQVVTVRLQTSTNQIPNKTLVAKIYDPLYVDDESGYTNPFKLVNACFSNEANSYIALSDMQGQGIPRYYGSYFSVSRRTTHKQSLYQNG